MGYYAFDEDRNYYENISDNKRKILESKFIPLRDKEEARNSLALKINAKINPKNFPGVFSLLQKAVLSGGFSEGGKRTNPDY